MNANRNRSTVSVASIVVIASVAAVFVPSMLPMFQAIQMTQFVALSFLALSLAYVWGHGGIMCFGQAMFFGIGGYAYAIATINGLESTISLLISAAASAFFALALGYFMFFGRLRADIVSIVTLVVSLIFYKLLGNSSGASLQIGQASLGGYNGIPGIPPLNVPFDSTSFLAPSETLTFSALLLILCHLFLAQLNWRKFGRVTHATQQNPLRAQLLGYDTRRQLMYVFAIGAAVAGLGGGLFAAYQNFIDPNVFALPMSSQALVWVMLGGRGTLLGPIIATWALQYLTLQLAGQKAIGPNIALGVIMMAAVLAFPKGLAALNNISLDFWRKDQKKEEKA